MDNKTITIEMTAKQIKKLGYELGYSMTMGTFSAIFMVNLAIGIFKAIERHADKKVKAAEEVKEEATEN